MSVPGNASCDVADEEFGGFWNILSEAGMIERRAVHRRHDQTRTNFPLFDQRREIVMSDRRRLPTRRVNDILVEELDCSDFLSEIGKKR